MELYLAPTDDDMYSIYSAAASSYLNKPYTERDAGFDTFCEKDLSGSSGATDRLMLGTKAAVWDKERSMFRAFWLLPRSSISKTPLRMANSVGLIDGGYRGVLMGAVDFCEEYTAKMGDRYFQITAPDLLPWSAIHIVKELPGGPTLRGEGGFGSTGKNNETSQATRQLSELVHPEMGFFY
jgi:dUTP pyrophosphatase